jgi:ABC-2 type transport system ATP-binding protein
METVEDLCDHIALIDKSKKILEGSKKHVKETYRSNTYWVEHRGAFALASSPYKILEQQKTEDDFFKSVVKVEPGFSPNQLIRDLTEVTEVHSFVEKIPTMSEIFISLVKGGNDG